MNTLPITETWIRAESQPDAVASRRLQIDILTSLEEAAPFWLEFERSGALASPYQRFVWASSWQETVGRVEGATPFIVVGRDHAGAVAFLWPLCRTRLGRCQSLASSAASIRMRTFRYGGRILRAA